MIRFQRGARRLVFLVIIGALVALSTFVVRASKPQPVKQLKVETACAPGTGSGRVSDSRYFYHPSYGWFDRTHFQAGNPAQVIADVRAAVGAGGGAVTIEQMVHDSIAGYTSTYLISADVTPQNEMAVALGIYQDWSYRFEAWQGELPQRLAGFLSPFAVEDLPSHYLGFFAEAHGLRVDDVIACYLPHTVETGDMPPRFTTSHTVVASADNPLNHPQRLTNEEMRPMVLFKHGWENVPWPQALQMEVIDRTAGLWAQINEESWYLDEEPGVQRQVERVPAVGEYGLEVRE